MSKRKQQLTKTWTNRYKGQFKVDDFKYDQNQQSMKQKMTKANQRRMQKVQNPTEHEVRGTEISKD